MAEYLCTTEADFFQHCSNAFFDKYKLALHKLLTKNYQLSLRKTNMILHNITLFSGDTTQVGRECGLQKKLGRVRCRFRRQKWRVLAWLVHLKT